MKDDKTPSKLKSMTFLRRNWYWIALITMPLLAAAILISVPYGIDYAAEQWLLSHGLDIAGVEDVDFNPFTGKLVLRNVQAKIADTQVLHVPEATLRIHWRPFFNKRAHIEKLSIKDTTVIVDNDEKGQWRIGGLALVAAKTVAEKPSESTWGFSLNQIEILNSRVEHVLGALKLKLTVEKATMGRLRSWDKEQAARLDFEGKINEANLRVQADFFPFADLPGVSGNVKLEKFSLQDLAELAAPHLRGLRGELSINSSLVVKEGNDKGISFSQQGKFSLRQVIFPLTGAVLAAGPNDEGVDLQVEEFVWDGQFDYGKENQPNLFRALGDVVMRSLQLDDIKREVKLVGLKSLGLKKISAQGLKQIKVPEVQIEQLHLIQRLQDNQQAGDGPSLFSASGATLRDVELAEGRELSIESVELSGISSLLRRDSQGKWQPTSGLFLPVKESKKIETGKSQRPVMVGIGQVRIADQGLFRFEDRGVSPPFKVSLTISEASLSGLDSGKPEQPSTVSLVGKIGEYTDVSIKGKVTPFTQRLGFDLAAKIDAFDLPPLSSYVVQLIGYKVKSGHLDTDIELQSLQGDLKGEGKFKIRAVEVAPADAEIMQRFERQLKVPLTTALAVLKDSKNIIELKVPITGDITDPKFNFTDAFNQALVKGMTKAAAGYLKHIFQPYGTMITVVELGIMAGKKATALRLDPVFFDPGSDGISANALPYLMRVAELMKTRPEIRIKVCGLATEKDKGDQKKTSGKEGPQQPTALEKGPDATEAEPFSVQLQPLNEDERLGNLAKQRAEGIKQYMVKNYGIEAARLLICLPEYDAKEGATPRVELLVP